MDLPRDQLLVDIERELMKRMPALSPGKSTVVAVREQAAFVLDLLTKAYHMGLVSATKMDMAAKRN